MFKISEFSKLSQVSVKTLRYYDQLGLLKPAHIDCCTGYRYYSADQLFQLNRILAFKEWGFTLNQISQLLDEEISFEQIQGMFRLKKAEIQTRLENEQAKLMRIEDRMRQLEREGRIERPYEVILKKVEPQLIVSLRRRASIQQIPELFHELDSYIRQYLSTSLSHMVLWHGCEECEEEIDLEVACPISGEILENSYFSVRRLPEVPTMATILHHCKPTSFCRGSTDLAMWIEQNGYRMMENEPRREIYLHQDDSNLHDSPLFIAEVQIPVEKVGDGDFDYNHP